MGTIWMPWRWSRGSNASALVNARTASTELSRRRVEREEVEHFLHRHRQLSTASIRSATRPA